MVAVKQLGNCATKFFHIKAKARRTCSNAKANQLSCDDFATRIEEELYFDWKCTYATSSSKGLPSFPSMDWEKEDGLSPAPREGKKRDPGSEVVYFADVRMRYASHLVPVRQLEGMHFALHIVVWSSLRWCWHPEQIARLQDYFKFTYQLNKCVWVNLNCDTSLNFRLEK